MKDKDDCVCIYRGGECAIAVTELVERPSHALVSALV